MLGTELFLAWRYIKSKGREKAISAIAAFSLVGIALGVATLIIVTSVMNGFRKEFTERIIGFNGHISLHPEFVIDDLDHTVNLLKAIPGVTEAVPLVESHALVSGNHVVRGTLSCGISFEDLKRKKLVSENIVSGNIENFNDKNPIVLGTSLAKRSGFFIGDDVVIIVPELDSTGFGFVPRKKTFKLVATFKSGMHEYDNTVSFIPLEIAQKLFKQKNQVSVISVFTDNPIGLSKIKKSIREKFEYSFSITDWQSSNSSFMKAVEIERNVMFLILLLITLVASFNIISCMIMLVKDKEKDIAILRTIGLSRNSILRVFFIVGSSIGTTGTFLGAILGLLFSINIQTIQKWIEEIFKTQVFSPEVYFLTHLPSLIQTSDVIWIICIALGLSSLATLYPARKASRLNPTDILRYA